MRRAGPPAFRRRVPTGARRAVPARLPAGGGTGEIGTATGINAALLAELVGPDGLVVTIELDEDLAESGRAHLAAGYQVTVLCRDGALGAPESAPFDRIIVTAGACG
ncbi:hypothetical protein ACFV4P_22700 [Kitasatospora sp. NPDC059795]|uniref:hypothetical protein n=1 Tax=Kitasatospora sp. NPDC059795 TaxID=3346949 RepID=UPI00364F1690